MISKLLILAAWIAGFSCLLTMPIVIVATHAPASPQPATPITDSHPIARVTFHPKGDPGPEVAALIEQHADSKVPVQRQHFLNKRRIALPDPDGPGWILQREKLTASLIELKEIFAEEWENGYDPRSATLMIDFEPHGANPGSSRIAVMQDVLGTCLKILGTKVQVGFLAIPYHRGLDDPDIPARRIYDSIGLTQGAIFIHPRFNSNKDDWARRGLLLTQRLLDRIEPTRDGRPVIAYTHAIRTNSRRSGQIPDDILRQQFTMLLDTDCEISTLGTDRDMARVLILARTMILERAQRRPVVNRP